jgi:hypothetical protein
MSQREEQEQGNSKEAREERQKEGFLSALSSGRLDTLQLRVAYILNREPDARNSDIALALAYWREFQSEYFDGEHLRAGDLYALERVPSLIRARAKIQNTYRLLQADREVRDRRRALAEQERAKAVAQRPMGDVTTVYTDESGKDGPLLLIGSVWVLHHPQIRPLQDEIRDWKKANNFVGEFHFKNINKGNVRYYLEFADFLVEKAAVLSFKAISMSRVGLADVDRGISSLLRHLILRGIQHEHQTGRAELPREVSVWKDKDTPAGDERILAELKRDLTADSQQIFEGKLRVGFLSPIESDRQVFIQVADLFAGSLNRVLNVDEQPGTPKYDLATHLLQGLGMPDGPVDNEQEGDMTVYLRL